MPRELRAFLPTLGDPVGLIRTFTGDPGLWLPEARQIGPDRWTMSVRAGAWSRRVEAHVGAHWRAGRTNWRALSWDPVSEESDRWPIERLLPSLDGEIGLHVTDTDATLMLDGRYRPPGGAVGVAIDRAALHLVARSTADRLLADVAARLSSEATVLASEPASDDPRTDPEASALHADATDPAEPRRGS